MKMQLISSILLGAIVGASMLGTVTEAAGEPKVSYLGSKSTFYDGDYKIYSVDCRNGKKGKISFWEDGRKWCVGVDKGECASSKRSVVQKICR